MKNYPSIITLFCMLAAGILWLQLATPGNPDEADSAQVESSPAEPLPSAMAQGQFKPSERIRADSVVAFPADI